MGQCRPCLGDIHLVTNEHLNYLAVAGVGKNKQVVPGETPVSKRLTWVISYVFSGISGGLYHWDHEIREI